MRLRYVKMKFTLFPHTKFQIHKKNSEAALNAFSASNIKYVASIKNSLFTEIVISSKNAEEAKDLLNKNKIELILIKEYGLFTNLKKFKRIGLIIGILLLLFCVYISSKFVWQINIDGNERLSEAEVEKILYDSGFFLGKFIPSVNYDKLHNEILLKSDEISWVSINIDGNVASVLIKESKKTSSETEYYSNIVAKSDAQIVEIKVRNGEQSVKIGDIVKEGELLISGIIDSQALGVRYEKAIGEVYARTTKRISVSFPYKGKEKIYTGRVYNDNKIKIFSKVINFSLKSNKNIEFCDKIEKSEQITLFGKYKLPIFIESTRYFEYELLEVEYSKREAVDLAFMELHEKIKSETANAELISKSVKTSYDDDGFYIVCSLECIENIAKEVRIYKE